MDEIEEGEEGECEERIKGQSGEANSIAYICWSVLAASIMYRIAYIFDGNFKLSLTASVGASLKNNSTENIFY